MKIGLVGEAPNDTESIKNLLKKKYEGFEFVSMLNIINGSSLDSQKTKRFLRIEYQLQKPDIVVFIRDLDSTLPNRTKLYERKNYFTSSNSVVDKKGISLLHIYEIEALLLTDIETFNRLYGTELEEVENVMLIEEPKEYLKFASKEYNESHNADLFKLIDFEKTLNCLYFNVFIKKLNKFIESINA
jgi:hypothetical protein